MTGQLFWIHPATLSNACLWYPSMNTSLFSRSVLRFLSRLNSPTWVQDSSTWRTPETGWSGYWGWKTCLYISRTRSLSSVLLNLPEYKTLTYFPGLGDSSFIIAWHHLVKNIIVIWKIKNNGVKEIYNKYIKCSCPVSLNPILKIYDLNNFYLRRSLRLNSHGEPVWPQSFIFTTFSSRISLKVTRREISSEPSSEYNESQINLDEKWLIKMLKINPV